ncbi:hypothetical protein S7711_05584 [Stachybotrys chartarum IBT 7711]|uniref:tRNA wybutosine-synthesizing protein 3 n=1 Tax=Stachybotrys chartarum (strain CBS 109288 / IBT 7711) TaxID=1280523 RepID=A0A084AKC6_STACB|nr:hypothetical protein S7711_05584 [Stachybotrys chartarum IBT 7711]
MQALPSPSSLFSKKKIRIVQQLAVPAADYADASPKGSVDEGIRGFVDEINNHDGFVTTSSCAGRVSVFLEGRKTLSAGEDGTQVAGVGGKGAGGTWLYVSHEPLTATARSADSSTNWAEILGLKDVGEATSTATMTEEISVGDRRLIHFKFEPMILHVMTASLSHAQVLLHCALQAGFRESGAVSVTPAKADNVVMPIVAVRSMGLSFESLVGYEAAGKRHCLVSPDYIDLLVQIANERFAENRKRIDRFHKAFEGALQFPRPRQNPDGEEWEDPEARRQRKRAEGLRKQRSQLAKESAPSEQMDQLDVTSDLGLLGGL